MTVKKALTIAGSDCSGGAGIQADLKTFQERDVYGMGVLTVMVAMRPENWTHVVFPVAEDVIEQQFRTILPGIGCDALKTGMLPTAPIIDLVGRLLKEADARRVVIDPVMVCKGGGLPLFPENTQAMIRSLMPLAEVTTPNTFEAAQLAGMDELRTEEELVAAAKVIHSQGARHVVIKAARVFDDESVDLLYDGGEPVWWRSSRLRTTWTHGAGCSFSACITAELAKGASVREAVTTANAFVRAGLEQGFPLNAFAGPIYHKAYAKQTGGR